MEHLHTDRDRMEALCCLSVIGELSAEESADFTKHLATCGACRDLKRQYEQLVVLDFPSAFAERLQGTETLEFDDEVEGRLFDDVLRRVEQERNDGHVAVAATERFPAVSGSCTTPARRRLKSLGKYALASAGWAVAASLLIMVVLGKKGGNVTPSPVKARLGAIQPVERPAPEDYGPKEVQNLRVTSQNAVAAYESALRQLTTARSDVRQIEAELASEREEYARLQSEKQSLEASLEQQKRLSAESAANLSVVSEGWNRESAKSASLETQLRDVNDKLITQKSEVSKLQQVALHTEVRTPVVESTQFNQDARELFGARDLHIVDVYDVDHSGKPSRTFGRVYFVNQQLLVFYAFDLNNRQKERKPVAFQAWGYKQPNSTAPENLGLFVMDDARLDRWVLRVSDPKLLASIDTLFVTVEPPGGSTAPKGHPLLLASLAGPPNHP